MRKYKIGIDARLFGLKNRGIGRYIQELLKNLEILDQTNQYFIFLYKDNFKEYKPKNKNFKKVLAPWRWYTLKEQIFFPFLIKKYKLDLVHFPHFNVPIFSKIPFIVTIHDLILLRDSQKRATTLSPIIYFIKKFFYKIVLKHAIKKSQKIICLTNFGGDDILQSFDIDKAKIKVIYNGLSLNNKKNQIDNKLKIKYNIKKPFFLYVGSAYPHKNLENLIKALKEIIPYFDFELFLVGKKDYFYNNLQKKYNDKFIRYLDFVPDNDLQGLYKLCFAFIFPSRYEGFGLPPLEAMANGAPVLSSNSSCLPEVLSDAAIYFDPNNITTIKNCIMRIIEDKNLRNLLIRKGKDNVKRFSWEICVNHTLEVYKEVLKNLIK